MISKNITLDISGLGIIFYSKSSTNQIKEGEDYLASSYELPHQVAEHVTNGTIVGFGTGSPGEYNLYIRDGYPNNDVLINSDFKLRLGVVVKDNGIWFRDLYDLMYWNSDCSIEQFLELDNGFYHVTLCGDMPESGVLGDEQVINMYFNKVDSMPDLMYNGVPMYCE